MKICSIRSEQNSCPTCEIDPKEIDLWDSTHRGSYVLTENDKKTLTEIINQEKWITTKTEGTH